MTFLLLAFTWSNLEVVFPWWIWIIAILVDGISVSDYEENKRK